VPIGPTAIAAYEQVILISSSAKNLLESDDLARADLAANNLETLRRLTEQLAIVEAFAVAAKERFSPADVRVTSVLAKTLRSAGWPLDPPPVLLMSKEGYWNQPQFGLIYAPAAEDSTLLGLPDLAHEVGHLLLSADEREVSLKLQAIVTEALTALGGAGLAPADVELRKSAWLNAWTVEFAADVIAAYLVGPAYLWQHLRLSIQLGRSPYQPLLGVSTHPAPRARFDCIAKVLTDLGVDLTRVKDAWDDLQARDRQPAPQYAAVYPNQVLSGLAEETSRACATKGIKSFQDAPKQGLVGVMNEAWQRFSDAEDLRAWDIATLARLMPQAKGYISDLVVSKRDKGGAPPG
jgi:hypothetical protein